MIHFSHYSVLDVKQDALPVEIQAAYLRRLKKLPKSLVGRWACFFFTGRSEFTLQKAYETLMDAQSRMDYDRALATHAWWPPI